MYHLQSTNGGGIKEAKDLCKRNRTFSNAFPKNNNFSMTMMCLFGSYPNISSNSFVLDTKEMLYQLTRELVFQCANLHTVNQVMLACLTLV